MSGATRREFLQAGGALVVGLALPRVARAQSASGAAAALGKTVDASELDAFIAVRPDSTVNVYCGKVDLGQGLRIAIPQMAAEELGVSIERIVLIEGDTALTPDQGSTGGSRGITQGGVEIRQAAATARDALLRMAAERTGKPVDDLELVDGAVRPKSGGSGIAIGDLVGDRRFALKIDRKAKLKDPTKYAVVGKPLARPDVPAKVTGRHLYVHDLVLDGMLHARVIRPPAVGAALLGVDESSIAGIPGARVVRIKNFLAVVAPDEWDAVVAARTLRARWSEASELIGQDAVRRWMRAGPYEGEEFLVRKGDAKKAFAGASNRVSAEYYWPMQSHASMGPSCAVADVRDGKATVWSASQATHKFHETCAKMLGLPRSAVRVIYLDGSGCYGMNGHDDVAADAALISRSLGRPVRVQWMREDEHGWDPKGPPQLLALDGALDAQGRPVAWRTEIWLPKATANLPNIPLLAAMAAGIPQPTGMATGALSQNGNPPYAVADQEVQVHWLKDSPLRPSNIRAPGKVGNGFAVESFVDELAAEAKRDPVQFRLAVLNDRRGIEVLERAAKLIDWQTRPSPVSGGGGVGRGIAYLHYKNNETYIATAIEAEVDRDSGAIRVRRVACAHDCGLIINPDALRQQIEGCILQTLSRTLHEEVAFDRSRVTSVDWASYRILTFPEVPEIAIDLIDRPTEPPLGAGEAAATTVPAALANAVFDATGLRLRTVPFTAERVRSARA